MLPHVDSQVDTTVQTMMNNEGGAGKSQHIASSSKDGYSIIIMLLVGGARQRSLVKYNILGPGRRWDT